MEEAITQLGSYIGVFAAILGLIAFIPQLGRYFVGSKQRRDAVKELNEINTIYDKLIEGHSRIQVPLQDREDNEKAVLALLRKRDIALSMFQDNRISQEQFSLLDNKISEYINKLQKNEVS